MDKNIIWWLVSWIENYTPSLNQYNFWQIVYFPFKPFLQKEINQIILILL